MQQSACLGVASSREWVVLAVQTASGNQSSSHPSPPRLRGRPLLDFSSISHSLKPKAPDPCLAAVIRLRLGLPYLLIHSASI